MKKAAIIIGRFQIHELQESQIDVISDVMNTHDKLTIVIGLSPLKGTTNNTLDFNSRKQMVKGIFPNIDVKYIEDDCSSEDEDKAWSEKLDKQIEQWYPAKEYEVTVFGTTEGFVNHYKGSNKYHGLDVKSYISHEEMIRQIKENHAEDLCFRMGMFMATSLRYPTAFQTVDVVIFNNDMTEVLMARKPKEKKWRFVGGFSEPTSPSLEFDAKKEAREEAGVEITDPVYIGSTLINDPRYRQEVDKIKTALFACKHESGQPKGGDDIAEVKWFKLDELTDHDIMPFHYVLLDMLVAWLAKGNKI